MDVWLFLFLLRIMSATQHSFIQNLILLLISTIYKQLFCVFTVQWIETFTLSLVEHSLTVFLLPYHSSQYVIHPCLVLQRKLIPCGLFYTTSWKNWNAISISLHIFMNSPLKLIYIIYKCLSVQFSDSSLKIQ